MTPSADDAALITRPAVRRTGRATFTVVIAHDSGRGEAAIRVWPPAARMPSVGKHATGQWSERGIPVNVVFPAALDGGRCILR